jgi:hypothetical protein
MFTPRLLADGRVCCSIEHAQCDTCKAQHDTPNGYIPALAALRMASTPTFEDTWKAERLAALAAEYAEEAR